MKTTFVVLLLLCTFFSYGQDTIVIGFGGYDGVSITASGDPAISDPENTINQNGYLPNLSAASRFLGQATLGYDMAKIEEVSTIGIEDWVDTQIALPGDFTQIV